MTDLSTSLKTGVSGKDIYVNVNPYKKPHAQRSAVCDNMPKELEVVNDCLSLLHTHRAQVKRGY